MKIVFMGTAKFAIPILDKIINSSVHDVIAVVTNVDKPGGRGRKLLPSPVKEFTIDQKIPVLQPSNLKDSSFHNNLKELKADIFVVVAFRILPESVFSIPPLGTINLHASLLPKYRGPAPIQWALINGDKETGLTTFRIDSGVDTGKLLLQKKIRIDDTETFGELSARMADSGADLVVETLDLLEKGELIETNQDDSKLSRAPKITTDLMNIDWTKPAMEIVNLVRGLSPESAVRTYFRETGYKIYRAAAVDVSSIGTEPGKIIKADKHDGLIVASGEGAVKLLEIQRQGKRIMEWQDFLRGTPLKEGDIFR